MTTNNATRSLTTCLPESHAGFIIRSFRAADRVAVRHLYRRGILGEQLPPDDLPQELDDIEKAYFSLPQDHLWVAEANSAVIGTVAISADSDRVMNLRWLRVAPSWQHDGLVAGCLLKVAVEHARLYGCLKLVFHTVLERQRAIELLDGMGLQLSRIQHRAGMHIIELYDDLYARRSG